MAVQAFKVYNGARRRIGNATINLSGTVFRITLHTSASNFATATLVTYASLTNQVAEGNGYSSSGKALASEVWTAGASAGQMKLDSDNVIWTATGGTIPNVKGAVIWLSAASAGGRYLVCYTSLTSSQFTLSSGQVLTIGMHSLGIFTLT